MKHLALYRKWRPQRFEDVVGQTHVSRTLLNAIRLDRLAHAYLFCGPRGTGKTSSARLLAKALNCENPVNYEPCNACQNCEEITAGHALDVIEIDAASNRGIDAARDLREQVRFSASAGKYRVFIIDEFHMLTKEAFNALLKTLEEPPEKVIFVLATTEPHAVLPTIVSRCQRFDFQRIGVSDMRDYLRKIADAENIGISDAALDALSRKANGGLRDGMSLLDQVQAIGEPGEALPDKLVYLTLGLVEENALIALLQAAFAGDAETLIQNTRLLLEQGHDALQVVQELIQLLRHLSLVHLPTETLVQLSVPAHLIEGLKALGKTVSRGDQVNALDLLLRTGDRLHHCAQPDIWLEADLLCLCLQSEAVLLKRIEQLEKQIQAGVSPAAVVTKPITQQPVQPASPTPPTPPTPTTPQTEDAPLEVSVSAIPPHQHEITEQVLPLNSQDPGALWEAFVEAVKNHQKPVIGFLMNGHLSHVDLQNKTWILSFQGRFQRDRIQHKLSDRSLQSLVSQIMGSPFEIEVTLEGEKKNREPVKSTAPVKPDSPQKAPIEKAPVEKDSVEPAWNASEDWDDGDDTEVHYSPAELHGGTLPEPLPRPEPPPKTSSETPLKAEPVKMDAPVVVSETHPVEALPIESLQEVADIFKGKIVARRH